MSVISFILTLFVLAQSPTGWDLLATTDIEKGWDPFLKEAIDKPKFPAGLKAMDGKKFTLDGFVIPMQTASNHNYFVLSRYPFQNCFFCGGAGPETVVEVYSDKKYSLTDQRVRVTGTLKLNENDPLHLFFILEQAQVTVL
jgi:hypothetical protein